MSDDSGRRICQSAIGHATAALTTRLTRFVVLVGRNAPWYLQLCGVLCSPHCWVLMSSAQRRHRLPQPDRVRCGAASRKLLNPPCNLVATVPDKFLLQTLAVSTDPTSQIYTRGVRRASSVRRWLHNLGRQSAGGTSFNEILAARCQCAPVACHCRL